MFTDAQAVRSALPQVPVMEWDWRRPESSWQEIRRAAAAGTVVVQAVVRNGELPEWVRRSPQLIARTGLDCALTRADFLDQLAGLGVVTLVESQPEPPERYWEAIAEDLKVEGVSLGCCGAVATPEVVRVGAGQVCGALVRLTVRVG